LGKVSRPQIRNELARQYNRLAETGLNITHIDSHHHIHLYPPIFKIFLRFAIDHQIRSVRTRAFKFRRVLFWLGNNLSIKQIIVLFMCLINVFSVRRNEFFADTDDIYDISWSKRPQSVKLYKLLNNLPQGTTEIVCHLAVLSEKGNPKFLKPRAEILKLVSSLKTKTIIKQNKIELISRNSVDG